MLATGTLLGNYRIVQLLASGGMGEVYVAEDPRLERRIALKVLPPAMAADPERLDRFEREAKVVASLNHPNIVTIHSVEEAAGPDGETLRFITMELVDGKTLDTLIPHGGLTLDRFFDIAVPLADAVGAAHHRDITHRDLKPGNVMLTGDGRLKVLDFGLAKLGESPGPGMSTDPTAATQATVALAPITEEGKVLGTVAYMSPEQAEGKAVDNRSDIFSLGIMLYEMATGALPFTGDTKMSLMSSIIKDTPISLTEVKRELPNHLGRIVKRCLEKNPERRFQSAQDVRNDLAGLREEIDSGIGVSTQSSLDAMKSAGMLHGGPATDPSVAAVPGATSDPATTSDSGTHHVPDATSDPAVASGATVASDPAVAGGPAAAPGPDRPTSMNASSAPAGSAGASDPAVVVPEHPAGTAAGATAGSGLLNNRAVLAGAAAALALVAGWFLFGRGGNESTTGTVASTPPGAVETVADARPSVAVLYFDNLSGDESLDWLRSGITELLVTDLSQSPELRVLTTDVLQEILEDSGNLEARATSATVVREVAQRGDVEHIVVGSFIRAGDVFRLNARLQKPSTGETLAAETVEGVGEDSVFDSVDDLTRRIKDRLQVPITASPVVDRDLSDVTTASMDAYRNYTDGVNLISQNRSEEAIAVFERALEIDPEFAMAFAKLSVVYGNLRDSNQERYWAGQAIEHADRLTQRERYYIEGRYYSQRIETIRQSIEAYENALALYPDDSASRNNLANQYLTMEMVDEAVAAYEDTLRRGTPFLPAYNNTADAYAIAGDCDRALELLRDFARNQPEYHFAYHDLAFMAVRCDRLDEAKAAAATYRESIAGGATPDIFDGIAEAQIAILEEDFDAVAENAARLADSSSPRARFIGYANLVAVAAVYRGRQSEAVDTITSSAEAAADYPGEQSRLWFAAALLQLEGNDPDGALASLDAARQTAQLLEDDNFIASATARAQARAGRNVAARTAIRDHERIAAQLPPPWIERDRLLVEAELAVMQDDLTAARASLETALRLLPDGQQAPPFTDAPPLIFLLGEVNFRDEQPAAAAEQFRRMTESGSQRIYYPHQYVRSFYYLGKIAEQDGDDAAARRNYQRFLDYWGEGELDRERVAEARAFLRGE